MRFNGPAKFSTIIATLGIVVLLACFYDSRSVEEKLLILLCIALILWVFFSFLKIEDDN